jgi:hypothetical protein
MPTFHEIPQEPLSPLTLRKWRRQFLKTSFVKEIIVTQDSWMFILLSQSRMKGIYSLVVVCDLGWVIVRMIVSPRICLLSEWLSHEFSVCHDEMNDDTIWTSNRRRMKRMTIFFEKKNSKEKKNLSYSLHDTQKNCPSSTQTILWCQCYLHTREEEKYISAITANTERDAKDQVRIREME